MKKASLVLAISSLFLLASCQISIPGSSSSASSDFSSDLVSSDSSNESTESTSSSEASSSEASSSSEQSSEAASSEQSSEQSSEEASSEQSSEEISSEESSQEQSLEPSSEEQSLEPSSEEQSLEPSSEEQSSEESSTPVPSTTYTLVESVEDLFDGDVLILGESSESVVAGSLSNGAFVSSSATYADNAFFDAKGVTEFTLKKNGSYWNLLNSEGEKLGATAPKRLVYDSGTTNWSISISDNGDATIASTTSSYGKILYNVSNPRFSTYTNSPSSTLVLPQLYRSSDTERVYPSDFSIQGTNTLSVGETTQLSLSYTPSEANVRIVSYASEDDTIASVSKTGLVTALSKGQTNIVVSVKAEDGSEIVHNFAVEVKEVEVTGISLSPTSKTIGAGKSFTLTPTVSPSNATDKSVTFESSNTSVATVDADGVVQGKSAGTATITAYTLGKKYSATCEVTVEEATLDSWTILTYICGADLESASAADYGGSSNDVVGLATADIQEMLSVPNQPEDVNIVLETGGASKWKSVGLGIRSDKLGRWHVRDGELINDAQLTYQSMGSSKTLQSFLEWGLSTYPAEKTALILWNHGGAMQGVCFDEKKSNDSLQNSEVQAALAGAFASLGRTEKLEFIGYDACLMQVQDIAISNAEYFNYMVGSQESEAGEGYVYDTWLDDVYDNKPTTTILKSIADGFIDAYEEMYGRFYDNDQTQAYLDLSKAEAYKEAVEAFAVSLKNKAKTSSDRTALLKEIKKAKCFGSEVMEKDDYDFYVNSYGYPSSWFSTIKEDGKTYYVLNGYEMFGAFDMYDFLAKIEASSFNLPTEIANVRAAFDEFVLYSRVGDEAGEAHGLSCIIGTNEYYSTFTYSSSKETPLTNWYSLVTYLAPSA